MASARPVAVVSGGSSGTGLATAEAFLEAGWAVALFSQQRANVEKAAESLGQRFDRSAIYADTLDLRDPSAIATFFRHVEAHLGHVDALVCNAGFSPKRQGGRAPLAEIPLDEWNDVLTVNLTGALLCCQAVLPGMAARRHGRIVLIGSLAGRTQPRIAGASYAASKAALAGFARSIVSEYAQYGITANTIAPGRIVTEMTGDPSAPANQAALSRIPSARLGRPEDIARAVLFLCAPEAGFVNGAILDINGGEFTPS